jgi:hypothetical protein
MGTRKHDPTQFVHPVLNFQLSGQEGWTSAVVLAYVAWLLPAGLGVLLDWPLWVAYALLVPGSIWYIATEGIKYYREATRAHPEAVLIYRVPMIGGMLIALSLSLSPGRFSVLGVVTSLVVIDFLEIRLGGTERRLRRQAKPSG